MSAATFRWPVRVYWEDTDAGGVVYHSVYLNYLERCRSEWLRALGLDQRALCREERLQFIVVDLSMGFRRPARFDDLLTITARAVGRGGASLTFRQTILRDDEELVAATVRVAAIDAMRFRPRRLPPAVVARFADVDTDADADADADASAARAGAARPVPRSPDLAPVDAP